jgi:hypothetical protein
MGLKQKVEAEKAAQAAALKAAEQAGAQKALASTGQPIPPVSSPIYPLQDSAPSYQESMKDANDPYIRSEQYESKSSVSGFFSKLNPMKLLEKNNNRNLPDRLLNNPANTQNVNRLIANVMMYCYESKELNKFYDHSKLEEIIYKAQSVPIQKVKDVARFASDECAADLYQLAFYNCGVLVDDSGSMQAVNNGESIDELKDILNIISPIITLFDADGVSVRFMNSKIEMDGVSDEHKINDTILKVEFNSTTPTASSLRNKFLEPFVYSSIRSNTLEKPVIIYILTDGRPDSYEDVIKVTTEMYNICKTSRYGKYACVLQFAQLGSDKQASQFLETLDKEDPAGDVIDCTSNYEKEAAECKKQKNGFELPLNLWFNKIILGPIDKTYDAMDEGK